MLALFALVNALEALRYLLPQVPFPVDMENRAAAYLGSAHPLEQCHRLYHSEGYAGGTTAGNSQRTGPEVGKGQAAASAPSPASRMEPLLS